VIVLTQLGKVSCIIANKQVLFVLTPPVERDRQVSLGGVKLVLHIANEITHKLAHFYVQAPTIEHFRQQVSIFALLML